MTDEAADTRPLGDDKLATELDAVHALHPELLGEWLAAPPSSRTARPRCASACTRKGAPAILGRAGRWTSSSGTGSTAPLKNPPVDRDPQGRLRSAHLDPEAADGPF